MFGKAIEEIYPLLGSPGWWFATVIMALLVNIISAFVYDAIKPYLQSVTVQSMLWVLVVVQGFLFFLSCLYFNPTTYQGKNMLPILGVVGPLAMLAECYEVREFKFAVVVTSVTVLSFAVFAELQINPPPRINAEWFARQYFYSTVVTAFVSTIWGIIVRWRVMRARRRKEMELGSSSQLFGLQWGNDRDFVSKKGVVGIVMHQVSSM
jgi:hypothetical protein